MRRVVPRPSQVGTCSRDPGPGVQRSPPDRADLSGCAHDVCARPAPSALRLPFRRQHGGVPDRGRRRRGRPRAQRVGHVLRPAGHHRGRQQRRGGLRPLPPLPRGRRADEGPRDRRLPAVGRLAADPARGQRPREPGRPRVLRPAGRHAARGRRPADGHAVPLGPAAGPRGPRRLAAARHRGAVRGVRHPARHASRGPRRALVPGQRAEHRHDAGARARRARPRQAADVRRAPGRPPPQPRARTCRRGAARDRGPQRRHRQQPRTGLGGDRRPRGRQSGRVVRRAAQPDLRRPDAARPLSGRASPT